MREMARDSVSPTAPRSSDAMASGLALMVKEKYIAPSDTATNSSMLTYFAARKRDEAKATSAPTIAASTTGTSGAASVQTAKIG